MSVKSSNTGVMPMGVGPTWVCDESVGVGAGSFVGSVIGSAVAAGVVGAGSDITFAVERTDPSYGNNGSSSRRLDGALRSSNKFNFS
ncbi:hypothetical protein GobsT_32170 [Gemmata obscuriglobus]|nr:hypothetical protein GobsT_32170 [Gemmata obscuriglobus]VTS06414.1 unnamed protein product [Gemmata obscuriglobus UQM 2246]